MTKEVDGFECKGALGPFDEEFVAPEQRQSCPEVSKVFLCVVGVYQYIIKVYKYKAVDVRTEDVIHHALESGRGVTQTEREDTKLKVPELCAKCRLGLVTFLNPYLMVPGA